MTAGSDGTKYPIFIIFGKLKKPPKDLPKVCAVFFGSGLFGLELVPAALILSVVCVMQGIIATVQESAFMNEACMFEYQDKIWNHKHGPMSWGGRVLGVFDSHRAHCTDRVTQRFEEKLNTDVVIIPGGCTSKVQPMDIGVNRGDEIQGA